MSNFAPRLSVIMVTYNNEADLKPTFKALRQNVTLRPMEIILIDNHSGDATQSLIRTFAQQESSKNVHILFRFNKKNKGFTHAVNQGLRHAAGDFILFLNPDVQLLENSVERMAEFLGIHPDMGIVAPQLLSPNGSVQPSCRHFPRRRDVLFELTGLSRIFPKSKRFNYWKMVYFSHKRTRHVDQPQGACLMTRRETAVSVGPWDERFFLFFSDVDWCRRVKRSHRKIYFYPEARAIHKKGSSVYRHRIKSLYFSHRDFIRYFWKYYPKVRHWPANAAMSILLTLAGSVRVGIAGPGTLFHWNKSRNTN